jgi:hypothetical protein
MYLGSSVRIAEISTPPHRLILMKIAAAKLILAPTDRQVAAQPKGLEGRT